MATQINYPSVQPVGVPGARATMLRGDRLSRTVETAAVPFGRLVSRGVADKSCKAFGGSETAADMLGITLLDQAATGASIDSNGYITGYTTDAFGVGESARILAIGSGGDVWVRVAVAVEAGDPVFVRPSNGDFQKTNANSAVQIPGAVFDTSAAQNGLAVVRLA